MLANIQINLHGANMLKHVHMKEVCLHERHILTYKSPRDIVGSRLEVPATWISTVPFHIPVYSIRDTQGPREYAHMKAVPPLLGPSEGPPKAKISVEYCSLLNYWHPNLRSSSIQHFPTGCHFQVIATWPALSFAIVIHNVMSHDGF